MAPTKTAQRPAAKPPVRPGTRPPAATPPKSSTALAKTEVKLPSSVIAAAARHAGKGISDRQEDNIVPLVYILQANSKPALKGHEKYIEGAAGGGVIWLRNLPEDQCIVPGEEGILFQPCFLAVCWIEWMPDRGGFVARHISRPPEARLKEITKDDGSKAKAWVMPDGNIVNESREYSGYVIGHGDNDPLPYTIPLSGSGHTIGKQWMTQMRAEKLPDGQRAPLFVYLYRLKVVLRTKGENSWFVFDIQKEGPVETEEDVERGAGLHDAFEAGLKESAGLEDIDTGAGEAGGEAGEDEV